MKRTLTTSLLAATAATSLIACVQQADAPQGIARALPTADQVRIDLPTGTARMLGELSQGYVMTRDVTRTFNGGAAWVLVLLHAIVQYPVTTVSGDTYTWGPWSDALDPAEYKLDVTDRGDGTYAYQLSGRNKQELGSAFEVVIDGVSDPRAGEGQGNGRFLLDFEAGRRVNPIDSGDARGQIDVAYDLAARHLELGIMSTDAAGEPVLATYVYNKTAAGGGDMVFDAEADAGGTALPEKITLRSRWTAEGTGRADARLTGGDLTVTAESSECWDAQFARVFYTDSVDFQPTEGSEAACAFATADLPPQ